MKYFKPSQLRNIICDVINPTIDLYRESKGDFFWSEYHQYVSENEIQDFINSTPYFDLALKDFLSNKLYSEQSVMVPNSWEQLFIKKVYLWGQSFEWLQGDRKFIINPVLNMHNIKNNAEILSLPETLEQIKNRNFFANLV